MLRSVHTRTHTHTHAHTHTPDIRPFACKPKVPQVFLCARVYVCVHHPHMLCVCMCVTLTSCVWRMHCLNVWMCVCVCRTHLLCAVGALPQYS